MSRIFRKITQGFHEIQKVIPFMMDDADVAVIAYGSVSRAAKRAIVEVRREGVKAGLLQLITLFPFPRHSLESVLRQCRAALVPEMNIGQISREVKRVNRWECRVEKHNRLDGQLMSPGEIYQRIMKIST